MSKANFTFILCLVLMAFAPNTTTWTVDPAHTKVGFIVKKQNKWLLTLDQNTIIVPQK